MKQQRWKKWEVAGLFFVLIWGNLFHFVFQWSGKNPLVAAIASTNESVWEHMKLLAVPWILWTVVEVLVLRRECRAFFPARALGLLSGWLLIPLSYYSYVGITGANLAFVNILIFQLAALLAFFVSWRVQSAARCTGLVWSVLSVAVLLVIAVLTVYWTYQQPQIPLFTDPLTGHTGIQPGSGA